MTALTLTGYLDKRNGRIDIDPVFLEDLEAIADKTQVTAVVTVDRNPDQLKAYWALLGSIIRSGAAGDCHDKDALDDAIRIGIGFGRWRALSDGRAVFIPDSISLSKCDGRKFSRFMWAMGRFLAERWGINVDDHRREAETQRRAAA